MPSPPADDSGPATSGSLGSTGSRGGWTPPEPEALQSGMPGYEVLSLLGRGGMGAVYKARQTNLDRLVAVKVLPPTLEDVGDGVGFAERFRQEARSMARLSHPAIVAVHDFGETPEGLLYFAMEFVEGMDILEYLRLNGGTLEPDSALAICAHVLDALDYAHRRGVVHRDIKPANVLIDTEGRVRVADFGLAKRLAGEDESVLALRTLSGIAMGTPAYMAPECLDPEVPVDHRADLYAVGVMLYQMLTGKLPQGRFQMPSKQNRLIDKRIDDLIQQSLATSPELRFADAQAFREGLDALQSAPVELAEERSRVAPMAAVREAAALEDGGASAGSAGRDAKEKAEAPRTGVGVGPKGGRSTAGRGAARRRPATKGSPGRKLAGAALAVVGAVLALFLATRSGEEADVPDLADASAPEARETRPSGAGAAADPQPPPPSDAATGSPPADANQAANRKATAAEKATAPGTTGAKAWEAKAAQQAKAAEKGSPPVPGGASAASEWPEDGPHFRSLGRFRAWSTQADDRSLNLERLAEVADVVQVYQSSGHWYVLRADGEALAASPGSDSEGVRRLFPTYGGYVFHQDEAGRARLVHSDPSSLEELTVGMRKDAEVTWAFLTPHSGLSLLKDGGIHAWGRHFEGTRPRWSEAPAPPLGRRAVAMSCADFLIAAQLDDGTLRLWDRSGSVDLPPPLRESRFRDFAVTRNALYGILEESGEAVAWTRDDGQVPLPEGLSAVRSVHDAGLAAWFLTESEEVRVVAENPERRSPFDPVLPYLKGVADPDLISLRVNAVQNQDGSYPAKLIWYDPAFGEEQETADADPTEGAGDDDAPHISETLLARPDFRSRIANYQQARHAQISALVERYDDALETARAETAADPARAAPLALAAERAAAFAASVEALLESESVAPLPPLPPLDAEAPPSLARLRAIFDRELARLEGELATQLSESLGRVQAEWVREGEIDLARELQTFRDGLDGFVGEPQADSAEARSSAPEENDAPTAATAAPEPPPAAPAGARSSPFPPASPYLRHGRVEGVLRGYHFLSTGRSTSANDFPVPSGDERAVAVQQDGRWNRLLVLLADGRVARYDNLSRFFSGSASADLEPTMATPEVPVRSFSRVPSEPPMVDAQGRWTTFSGGGYRIGAELPAKAVDVGSIQPSDFPSPRIELRHALLDDGRLTLGGSGYDPDHAGAWPRPDAAALVGLIAFGQSEELVAALGADGTVRAWDSERTLEMPDAPSEATDIVVSERRVYALCGDGRVYVSQVRRSGSAWSEARTGVAWIRPGGNAVLCGLEGGGLALESPEARRRQRGIAAQIDRLGDLPPEAVTLLSRGSLTESWGYLFWIEPSAPPR